MLPLIVDVAFPDLQAQGTLHTLSWVPEQSGRGQSMQWKVTCKSKPSAVLVSGTRLIRCPRLTVNGEVKGVGIASQQGAAKAAAAKETLEALGVAV